MGQLLSLVILLLVTFIMGSLWVGLIMLNLFKPLCSRDEFINGIKTWSWKKFFNDIKKL